MPPSRKTSKEESVVTPKLHDNSVVDSALAQKIGHTDSHSLSGAGGARVGMGRVNLHSPPPRRLLESLHHSGWHLTHPFEVVKPLLGLCTGTLVERFRLSAGMEQICHSRSKDSLCILC